jgi:hypothetical protein
MLFSGTPLNRVNTHSPGSWEMPLKRTDVNEAGVQSYNLVNVLSCDYRPFKAKLT